MIQVRIGNTTETKTVVVEKTKTLKEAFDDNGIDYSVATIYLNGCTINPGDLNKSFEDNGIGDSCTLMAIINTKNA